VERLPINSAVKDAKLEVSNALVLNEGGSVSQPRVKGKYIISLEFR
jgi:hypothetical protein